ncbi:MAG: N-acetylmuramoyl-L-alanine amidase [Candidatus Paceibacterota bacterium]
MRHIFAVVFLIMLLAVPWFMYNPEQASYVYSIIGKVENQIAAVILTHSPKTVVDIKSRYADAEKQTVFGTKVTDKKVKILLVPGHEPDYGGAEYGSLFERKMTVEIAEQLQKFLDTNGRYQVYVTRDENSWSPMFFEYFKNNWSDIIAWTKGHKEETVHLTRMGEYHPVVPNVIHNNAPNDVAFRLYGLGKWSNENDVDIIIHLHFNDAPGHGRSTPGKYSGFSIYVPENQYFNSSTTLSLANTIFSRLQKYNGVSNLPGESGGIIQDQDLIAVGAYNSLDAASLLIEYGYIYEPQFTNPDLHDTAVKDLAFQTYLGLQDFFDERSPANVTGSFDTLVMPYSWSNTITDSKHDDKDVFSLQTALVIDGVYPPANKSLNDCPRSGSFGPCTKASVDSFQNKRGIVGEKGVVGVKTLQELNRLYSIKAI